jgi:hypothetical protein
MLHKSSRCAAAIAVCAMGATARAEGTMEACAKAYEGAQQDIRAGALIKSRSELTECAKICPTALSKDCTTWHDEVERQIPSLRMSALRVDGSDPGLVRVIIDHAPLAEPLSGTPIDVDPGKHVLLFEASTRHRVEVSVDVPRGRKGYAVEVTFPVAEAPIEPQPTDARRSPAWVPLMVAGVGFAALGAGGILGIKGQVDRTHLLGSCAPHCPQGSVDAIAREWTAGAGLAAAGGSFALAGMLWWILDGRPRRAPQVSIGPRSIVVSGRF